MGEDMARSVRRGMRTGPLVPSTPAEGTPDTPPKRWGGGRRHRVTPGPGTPRPRGSVPAHVASSTEPDDMDSDEGFDDDDDDSDDDDDEEEEEAGAGSAMRRGQKASGRFGTGRLGSKEVWEGGRAGGWAPDPKLRRELAPEDIIKKTVIFGKVRVTEAVVFRKSPPKPSRSNSQKRAKKALLDDGSTAVRAVDVAPGLRVMPGRQPAQPLAPWEDVAFANLPDKATAGNNFRGLLGAAQAAQALGVRSPSWAPVPSVGTESPRDSAALTAPAAPAQALVRAPAPPQGPPALRERDAGPGPSSTASLQGGGGQAGSGLQVAAEQQSRVWLEEAAAAQPLTSSGVAPLEASRVAPGLVSKSADAPARGVSMVPRNRDVQAAVRPIGSAGRVEGSGSAGGPDSRDRAGPKREAAMSWTQRDAGHKSAEPAAPGWSDDEAEEEEEFEEEEEYEDEEVYEEEEDYEEEEEEGDEEEEEEGEEASGFGIRELSTLGDDPVWDRPRRRRAPQNLQVGPD